MNADKGTQMKARPRGKI